MVNIDEVPPTKPGHHRSFMVGMLVGVSLVNNVAALLLPFIVVDAAGSSPLTYGLLGSVQMLRDSDMHILAALVFSFSVVLPLVKLAAVGGLWWWGVTTPRRRRFLELVESLGKWSLFDVFLIAIMVGVTSDQWLISSESLTGVTCFLVAIVGSMFAGEVLSLRSSAHEPPAPLAEPPRLVPAPLLLVLTLIAGALLAATLLLPFIQVQDWRLSDKSYSLYGLVPVLWHNGSPVLAAAVGAFLVVAPILRWFWLLLVVCGWWRRQPPRGMQSVAAASGRWSMLVVFALSLVVFLAEGHRFLGTVQRDGTATLVVLLLVGGIILTVCNRTMGRR